jgi:anti-sigma B factor antagonist
MDFALETTKRGRYAVLAVRGEVDALTAPQLRTQIDELVTAGEAQLVVDLEAVDFLDSSALGALVGGLNEARAHGGSLSLVCSSPRILQVFQITQLEEVFAIHESLDAATPG